MTAMNNRRQRTTDYTSAIANRRSGEAAKRRNALQRFNASTFCALLVALGFLVLCPLVAAIPLPGFNTADGQNALSRVTSGSANSAAGWFSLFSDAAGSFNTASGAGSLLFNTADRNTAFGAAALLFNNTGAGNTGIGAAALLNNIDGGDNTAVGASALSANTATGNTAIGSLALLNNTTGGTLGNTQGFDVGPNVAVGTEALKNNTIGSANTAVGYQALGSFIVGNVGTDRGQCTAVGFQALANSDGANGGIANSGFGYQAMFHNTDGFENVAIGDQALFGNETGFRNTAIGGGALSANTSGNSNTVIGNAAGGQITTGHDNVCIGAFSDVRSPNDNNTTHIANIGDTPQGGGLVVTVDPSANNQLGYAPSSRRYKQDIEPMNKASQAILALKPVSFRYKKKIDPAQMRGFGLIAEEVDRVDSDLVARNRQGQPESVRYEYINAMLLNEFLKEHRRVGELEKGMAALTAQIKEQAEEIQMVRAQIEVDQPRPVLVRNHR
jgi:trimeric autotransporter adhesin